MSTKFHAQLFLEVQPEITMFNKLYSYPDFKAIRKFEAP